MNNFSYVRVSDDRQAIEALAHAGDAARERRSARGIRWRILMPEYVLDHHDEGERERIALMSELLDPVHPRHVERLGIGPGARTLEVGCGNGST